MLMTYWQQGKSDGSGAPNETKHETHEYQIFNEQCVHTKSSKSLHITHGTEFLGLQGLLRVPSIFRS